MTSGGQDEGVTAALYARIDGLDDRVAALESALSDRSAGHAGRATDPAPADPARAYPEPTGGQGPRSGPARAYPAPAAGTDWSRLPVWAGAVVTVGGVVMLVVLAASAGWFSPAVRVTCGALLGVALLVAGIRSAGQDGAGAGARALAGTGVLALFCSIAAATALYPLLPVPVGLAGTLAVTACGMVLADRWDSRMLALWVLITAGVALPVVGDGPSALVFGMALTVQVGVAAVALRRTADGRSDGDGPGGGLRGLAAHRFGAPGPVAAGVTALHGLLAAPFAAFSSGRSDDVRVTAVAALALAAGTAIALLAAHRAPSARRVASVGAVWIVALSALPLLAAAGVLGGTAGALVAGVAALVMAGVAAIGPLDPGVRLGSLAVGCVLAMSATAILLDGDALTCALLAEALAVLASAAALRTRALLAAGAAFALPGTLLCLARLAEPSVVAGPLGAGELARIGVASAGAALLVAVAGAALVAARRNDVLGVAAGSLPVAAVGLYGAGWLAVVGTQLVLPGPAGFRTGHVLVTVAITVLGLVLLVRGLRNQAARWAGLVLVGAALVKLVLVDLIALDGIARVVAFLAAGLLLLVAGSRYARRVGAVGTGPERAA